MKGPHVRHIRNYAGHCLGLKSYFRRPGDGRRHPHIPARDLVWAVVIGRILRVLSFFRLDWLAHSAVRAELGLAVPFGDDALAYCTERMDAETTRLALAAALHQAKRNKAFENSRFLGLAVDGTGAGRTYKEPCRWCVPLADAKGEKHGSLHHFALISVVGAGLTLPVDVEPYGPGDSEYAAAQRLLRRAVRHLGPRFADYVVGDGEYATAPFLHTTAEIGLPVVARLKENLPLLAAAMRARFDGQPPQAIYQQGDDRVEVWDADDFDPWETLDWPTVRVLRYRQHKRDGTVIQAEWLSNFSLSKLGSLSFYRMAKSRWEIENGGFNDGKNRYGMEHICHHQPHSILIVWLLILLALVIERLYRLRYLHRGEHAIRSAMDLFTLLWLSLGSRAPDTS
ncbi:MAG TPA: transposase [Terracidiphilus sp.]